MCLQEQKKKLRDEYIGFGGSPNQVCGQAFAEASSASPGSRTEQYTNPSTARVLDVLICSVDKLRSRWLATTSSTLSS